jgi:hypothetical protein
MYIKTKTLHTYTVAGLEPTTFWNSRVLREDMSFQPIYYVQPEVNVMNDRCFGQIWRFLPKIWRFHLKPMLMVITFVHQCCVLHTNAFCQCFCENIFIKIFHKICAGNSNQLLKKTQLSAVRVPRKLWTHRLRNIGGVGTDQQPKVS